MLKELGMTSYLQGLKDIFDTHDITEVYSEYPFSAEQDDGVNLYIDAPFDVCNKSQIISISTQTMMYMYHQS